MRGIRDVMNSKIISFCGIDGSGKSTHIKSLKESLVKKVKIFRAFKPAFFTSGLK